MISFKTVSILNKFNSSLCIFVGMEEVEKSEFTLRKNSAPDGSRTRCEPGAMLTGFPSLSHRMLGIGDPSALQLRVTGSWRGTVVSIGCSVIRGICKPEKKEKNH